MKWIILIAITVLVVVWLMRGKRRNNIEDPQVKTVEQQDYYVTPDDKAARKDSSHGDTDRHG